MPAAKKPAAKKPPAKPEPKVTPEMVDAEIDRRLREVKAGDALDALRVPFGDDEIDHLPRGVDKNGRKASCNQCGGYHAPASVHLDYVGHAAVTNRFLNVDPHWNWEPVSFDENGVPMITIRNGMAEMWIKLKIGGMTRYGVGTAKADKEEVTKELIGDALRNAAMRFGVALDLWKKGDADLSANVVNGDGDPDASEGNQGHPEWIAKQVVLESVQGNKDEAQVRWELICHDLDLDPTGPFSDDALKKITKSAEEYGAAESLPISGGG